MERKGVSVLAIITEQSIVIRRLVVGERSVIKKKVLTCRIKTFFVDGSGNQT